ncbi:DNA-binding SARP family transcriptional activator/Tfp pilus assembly protein PilF [Allocatelliglobosispora scoriae]|uniref:DNA-binding SARP family transcriptional activator/Tfp pilus assembly protein PilF n=1 Tax=Allocatelliglobosispora scoriae TaxID=643052 RepID=A0A841C1P1_9ACTN|nr:BTAD domain-containing putative transcriptional regulator [Allocatelliglobosispora scoriae]MBB5874274.1 DNA-binding SARP family transcriptional activator/Tfp pilus assembly protein PilF [Allocatelliglobosispora scoriae]
MVEGGTLPDLARLLRQLKRRDARRRGGAELSYRALAARTGWSAGMIAHYFTGKTLPPTDRFDTLIRLLGATPAEQGKLATLRDHIDEDRRQLAAPGAETVRLLGPIEVIGPRGPANLVGSRQRTLIGLLGLRTGSPVSHLRLIDALWGDDPPRTATQSLYSHIARVRQALDDCGLPGILVTRDSGYLLNLPTTDVDITRFDERVAEGRQALARGAAAEAVTCLLDALALWRGTAFEDGEPSGWAAAEVERLAEARLSALDDLWDARLRLGEHATAVDEIERLLAANPVRERLVGTLMLALCRSGRHASAIEAYQRLRTHLSDELGVEPSPQLQRLNVAVLRRDPMLELEGSAAASTPRPAQLPPGVGHFTGRAEEESVLRGMFDGTCRVGVISGPGGMGKTALAVHWARQFLDRFPDGQLFLDLRGHDPATAMPTEEALTHLLRALGISGEATPANLGLYRSALQERRMLILLDNASSARQIAPLVPPNSDSMLIVTSRHQLAALALDHEVTAVHLDTLTREDASVLLRRVLGDARVDREQSCADQLVDLCGRMPLALRIATAKLAARPQRLLAELVADLTGEDRLGALSVPGDARTVRAVFATAYQALSPLAATLFRRLGNQPGPTFSAHLAAALAGQPVQDALDELAVAHLVTEVASGRYRFHDLIRLYAIECCAPDEQAETLDAILTWYLAMADRANHALEPARDRVKLSWDTPPPEMPFLADTARVLSFLDTERPNLLPIARHATEHRQLQTTWQLTYLLASYYTHRGYWSDYTEICREGLAAALRLDDPVAERLMRSGLGVAHNVTHHHDSALEQLTQALELMRDGGDQRGQGMALNNIAHAYAQLGRLPAAADAFQQALDLHTADNHLPGITLALNNIADIYIQMGDSDRAFAALERALRLAREIDNAHLEGAVLQNIGEAHLATGDEDGALRHFALALAIRHRIGEKRREADTSNAIGLIHVSRGDHASALDHFSRALALCREINDRGLESATLANMALLT